MRLDKYLKVSRLIKRRTVANDACDAGRVMVNDKVVKASYDVKLGDVIEISFGNALPPKHGGNTVIQNHREHVKLLPVTQHYELADIDTPEDMQAMEVIAAHALAK